MQQREPLAPTLQRQQEHAENVGMKSVLDDKEQCDRSQRWIAVTTVLVLTAWLLSGCSSDSALEDFHVIRGGERFLLPRVRTYIRRTAGKEPCGQNEDRRHGYPPLGSVTLLFVIKY